MVRRFNTIIYLTTVWYKIMSTHHIVNTNVKSCPMVTYSRPVCC